MIKVDFEGKRLPVAERYSPARLQLPRGRPSIPAHHRRWRGTLPILWLWIAASSGVSSETPVRLSIREPGAPMPLPCRVHLTDSKGQIVLSRNYPAFQTHFTIPGEARLELSPGTYRATLERGPEYTANHTELEVPESGSVHLTRQLKRIADLAREGWWSGDLHIHRPPGDIELLMRGEDLHVAPVITWWHNRKRWISLDIEPPYERVFDGNRFYDLGAGEDEREGGAVQFFGLKSPLPIEHEEVNGRPTAAFLELARRMGARIVIEKPFWGDVPVWIASGLVDSIEIANNHMLRHGVVDTEAWGYARDIRRFPGPHGNGLWSQEIYYRLLEAGLRIPPSAGSASGVLPNPVGYNRVYVHIDGEPTYQRWWTGLLSGRCFVTNGPLLRVIVDGQLPGHVFHAFSNRAPGLRLEILLDSRDPIDRIELIQNGQVKQAITGASWKHGERFSPVQVDQNGWFLVRAIADVRETFRFASTAPYYVEIAGAKPRIIRSATQFFLRWLHDRAGTLENLRPDVREEAAEIQRKAEAFWQGRLTAATVP